MHVSQLPPSAVQTAPGEWSDPGTYTRYYLDPHDATICHLPAAHGDGDRPGATGRRNRVGRPRHAPRPGRRRPPGQPRFPGARRPHQCPDHRPGQSPHPAGERADPAGRRQARRHRLA